MFTPLLNGKSFHGSFNSVEEAVDAIRYIRDNAPYDVSTKLSVRDDVTGTVTVILPPMKKEKP